MISEHLRGTSKHCRRILCTPGEDGLVVLPLCTVIFKKASYAPSLGGPWMIRWRRFSKAPGRPVVPVIHYVTPASAHGSSLACTSAVAPRGKSPKRTISNGASLARWSRMYSVIARRCPSVLICSGQTPSPRAARRKGALLLPQDPPTQTGMRGCWRGVGRKRVFVTV